jgi:LmbE family N-acetylglucosaminyl deacetylase
MSDELEFSKALVFCPHPDDGEFSAGGTMAKWASEGKEVILVVVTNGAAGSNDPAVDRDWLISTREQEQRAAAKITGLADVIFLGHEDGFVSDSHELRRDMIREIRRIKPEVAVGLDPTTYYFVQRYINHPDHRAVGEAFLAAVNPGATTVPLYRDELYDKGFEPHQLKACLLGFTTQPDYFVDISDHFETKVQSIMAHKSQMGDDEQRVRTLLEGMGAMIGGASGKGYKFAEGFKMFDFESSDIPAN